MLVVWYLVEGIPTNSNRLDVPGCPGVPQVTHVGSHDVELAWLRPDSDGRAGPLIGYQACVLFSNTFIQ